MSGNQELTDALERVAALQKAVAGSQSIALSLNQDSDALTQAKIAKDQKEADHDRKIELIVLCAWIAGIGCVLLICASVTAYGIFSQKDNLLPAPLALSGSILGGISAYLAGKKSKK